MVVSWVRTELLRKKHVGVWAPAFGACILGHGGAKVSHRPLLTLSYRVNYAVMPACSLLTRRLKLS